MRAFFLLSPAWVTAAIAFTLAACGIQPRGLSGADNANVPAVGYVFRGSCAAPADAASAPLSLLDTGCFTSSGKAASSLYSYQVNGVLWADSATKTRWLLLPTGRSASIDGNGVLQLPSGGAVIKQFDRDGTRLETRFLFPDSKGVIQALTYAWNDAGTDAELVGAEGSVRNFADASSWEYFSRDNCLYCHNPVAGSLLGPRLPQLARTVLNDANQVVNQLVDMAAHKVLTPGFDPNVVPWPSPSSEAPIASRARSYLATNCACCHTPGGTSGTRVDLRYDTPLNQTGACNVEPNSGDFGIAGAKIITPGNPNASVMSFRLHSKLTGQKMPPVGHAVTDAAGVALIDAYIASLTGCDGP